jgi:hypothetical protein
VGISPIAPRAAHSAVVRRFAQIQGIPYLSMVPAYHAPQSFIYQYFQDSNDWKALFYKGRKAQCPCKY